MKEYIENRVASITDYILETKATVRKAAKEFKISKSTVHKDVTERLLELNPEKARRVKAVLMENMSERHIRGGQATKMKYIKKSED